MIHPKRLTSRLAVVCLFASPGLPALAAPAFQALGEGAQVYACQAAGGTFAWKLVGPDAVLTGADGQKLGRHFAGPSWQAPDGSTIVGEAVGSSPSPREGAVAWLVLRARSTAGPGLFSSVIFVTRTQTQGGVAPASGCDAGHVGQQARAPYSATYTFFTDPAASPH